MEHVIYRFLVGIWNPVSKKKKIVANLFFYGGKRERN